MNCLVRPLNRRCHAAIHQPTPCADGGTDAGPPGGARPAGVTGVHSVATPAVLAGVALMLLLLSGCGGGSDAASEQGSASGNAAAGTSSPANSSASTSATSATTSTSTTTAATTSTSTSTATTSAGATTGTTASTGTTAGAGASAGTSTSGTSSAARVGGTAATTGTPANAAPVIGTTSVTPTPASTAGSSGAAAGTSGSGASSQSPLADCGLNDHVDVILSRINALRARGASCGARGSYAPAAAMIWNTRLHAAAAGHSVDMATHNYFAHTSPDGQTLTDRVVAVDYSYRLVAENIAAGQTSLDSVLASWMASDGHCANLMHPQMRELGLSCQAAPGARYASYWTLNLGVAP